MRVLAIDPGSRWTAIVARDIHALDHDDSVVYATVLDRREHTARNGAELPLEGWVRLVVDVATDARDTVNPDEIVVEEALAPNPHLGTINPSQIIATSAIVGGIVTAFTSARIVPTGNYGAPVANRRILLAAYPSQLVGPRETTGRGKSRRQHARAAWEMAATTAAYGHA